MTPAEFTAALNALDLDHTTFRHLTGVSERTCRGYASGERPIPQIVEVVLEYMQKEAAPRESAPQLSNRILAKTALPYIRELIKRNHLIVDVYDVANPMIVGTFNTGTALVRPTKSLRTMSRTNNVFLYAVEKYVPDFDYLDDAEDE